MNTGVIKSMLLLDEPNISALRIGIENYSKVFLLVVFIGALTWEFLTDMKFIKVVKNLVLSLVFMGCFYQFHTSAVDLSFKASEELLREVSPRNIFLRKWSEVKVKTTENAKGSFIDKIAIPNLNDLLGTALFLMSKVCILILKLIYTTVYYFTFIFAPITAVLSFIPTSKNSMAGTITSSLWCILLPFVLVVFLALVGNSVQMPAENGQLAVSSMDQLIWIFGITLLMLLAPSFTYSLIKGSVASTADAVGVKMTEVGAKALISIPVGYGLVQKLMGKDKNNKGNKGYNFRQNQNYNPNSKRHFSNPQTSRNNNLNNYLNSVNEKGGFNSNRSSQNNVKLSETKTMKQNTKQQTTKQSLPVSSGLNLSNQESVRTNTVNSKIPVGAFKSVHHLNQNRSTMSSIPKNSSMSPLPISKSVVNTAMTPHKNIFKQVELSKVNSTKSELPHRQAKDFKTVRPKERQHEV